MGSEGEPRYGLLPIVRTEGDILTLALEAAARNGDANPQLVEHTAGTREAATTTTGSLVYDDQPSYLIAIRGRFTAHRRGPPMVRELDLDEGKDAIMSFSVVVLVVDIETGRVTDSGSSNDYPDLAAVGSVVTDYSTARA